MAEPTPRHRRASQARLYGPCVICSQDFANTSARPRWAFYENGTYAGTCHTSCGERYGKGAGMWTTSGEQTLEDARFQIWRAHIHPRPTQPTRGQRSAEWEAYLLAGMAEADLSSLAADALLEYKRLLTDYQQWRATLDDTPPVSREDNIGG